MQPVRGPYNNEEDTKEEDDSSSENGSKLDEKEHAFDDCQNNKDDSDEEKDVNAGNDTIFVDNLVWEDIDNDLVIPDMPYHYCVMHGFK